jgi:hypothetical protein
MDAIPHHMKQKRRTILEVFDMFLLAHVDLYAVKESAEQLQIMGKNAINLLEVCVAEQIIERVKLSAAAILLDGAGFIRINDSDLAISSRYKLSPTLAGEEALEYLHDHPQELFK